MSMSEAPKSESDKPGGGAGAAPPQHSARQGAARAGGPALEAMYQLLLWLIPTLEKLPRSQNSCWATACRWRPRGCWTA